VSDLTAAAFPGGKWRARWIWCESPPLRRVGAVGVALEGGGAQRFGCFRRAFELERWPSRVPARISADSRYVLWLNGVEISRGPVRSNPRRLHYDPVDLAPQLRPGRNLLAVLCRFYGRPTPWWAPAPPTLQLGAGSLLFEARLGEDDWLISDAGWRARASDAWRDLTARGVGGMAAECHDARQLAHDWRERDFDDSDWSPAVVLAANSLGFSGRHEPPSHPYGPLLPRPIPQLTADERSARVIGVAVGPRSAEQEDPVDQVGADAGSAVACDAPAETDLGGLELPSAPEEVQLVTLDFGEVVSGTLVLDVAAPAGAQFDLAASEFLREDGHLDLADQHCGMRYVARGERDRFESFDSLGLRYAEVSVRSDAPVALRSLGVRERLYPRSEGPGFQCSDPLLERIWAVGRRTVDLCSHDAYLDCPTREQRAWTGDFVVHQMVDLASNPDWGLARWNVELAASPRPDGMLPMAAAGDIERWDAAFIPDWALHWIRALHNLYRYTADRALVARLLPVAENVLRWFVPFQAEDGLLADVTGWVIIDWSSVSVDGRSSTLNALWARGLLDFAEMSEWLGDAGRVRWARASHASLAAAFEAFWDPERRVYVDHIAAGGRARPLSQHAQAAALCARLVPGDRIERMVEVLTDRESGVHAAWSCPRGDARFPGPGERGVGGAYLLAGPPDPWWDLEKQIVVAQPFFRYVVHDALVAAGRVDLIPDQCRDWQALLERCGSSWSETWYGGTTSHAWSATPTRDLSTRTLGVTPAEPGFGVARVAPSLGDLEWVRGAVPTPYGLLSVEADRERSEVESPVPFVHEAESGEATRHPAGRHTIRRTRG
jgi:hypothetical protein